MRATITWMEGPMVCPGGHLQSWRGYGGQTLVFVSNSAMREMLVSGAFWVWREDWALGYNSTEF